MFDRVWRRTFLAKNILNIVINNLIANITFKSALGQS